METYRGKITQSNQTKIKWNFKAELGSNCNQVRIWKTDPGNKLDKYEDDWEFIKEPQKTCRRTHQRA